MNVHYLLGEKKTNKTKIFSTLVTFVENFTILNKHPKVFLVFYFMCMDVLTLHVHVCASLYVFVCVQYMTVVSAGTRRKCQIPWN